MLGAKAWTSLCLLAGSLRQSLAIGLTEHPDVKAISVSYLHWEIDTVANAPSYAHIASSL
jgi:hypothetical protein